MAGVGNWPKGGPYGSLNGNKDLAQDGYFPGKALISKVGIDVKDFNSDDFNNAVPFRREWDQDTEHRCRNFYVVNYTGRTFAFTSNLTPLLADTPNRRENTRTLYEWSLDHCETCHHPCMPHNYHISVQDFSFSKSGRNIVGATPSGFDLSNIEGMWVNLFKNADKEIDVIEEQNATVAQKFAVISNTSADVLFLNVYEIPIGYANGQEQAAEAASKNTFDVGPSVAFQVKLNPGEKWDIRVGDFYYTVRAIETAKDSHLGHPASIITLVPPVDDFVTGAATDKIQVGMFAILLWDKNLCRVCWYLYKYDEVKRVNAQMVTNRG